MSGVNGGRPVLTTKAVAGHAGCTTSNVRRLAAAGVLHPVGKIGQTVLFDEAQIMAWLPTRRRQGERPGQGRFKS